jgi:ribosomal protein RSM22 (predicted rRNA methylase)
LNNGDLWWSVRSPNALLDAPALVARWEADLIELSKHQNQPGEREKALQSLGDLSKSLWQAFNTDRAALDRDYMATERHLSAYLSAFFIPNIERSRHILTRPSAAKILKDFFKKDKIHILDFGAGPLSSTFGFLIALGEVAEQLRPSENNIRHIKIVAVERSERSVRMAQTWLSQCISPSIQIEVERRTSVPADHHFDVVLASNVFNEIPQKHHLKTFNILQKSLNTGETLPQSLLLIVEPGQEIHSRNLVELRDQVLQQGSELKLLSPCPHTLPCPLGANMKRPDWCWFRRTFKAPPFQLELDQRTQIDHQDLAFSHLLFVQKPAQRNAPWAVCVSDPIPMGDVEGQQKREIYFRSNRRPESASVTDARIAHLAIHGAKTKLCSQSGELLAGISEGVAAPLRHRRGDEIHNGDEFELIIQER